MHVICGAFPASWRTEYQVPGYAGAAKSGEFLAEIQK